MTALATVAGCLDVIAAASSAERKLHQLFGFDERWRYLPIEDHRADAWAMENDRVWWLLSGDRPHEDGSNYTDPSIYNGIVHRAEGLVLVGVDTQCDGNMLLAVFDEAKRILDREAMIIFAGDEDWEPPPDWPEQLESGAVEPACASIESSAP